MLSLRSLCILALVTLSGVVTGCINDDLHIKDTDQLTPSGRISYEFWPGNNTRRTVCQRVAPIASEASRNESGTAFSASSPMLTMIGTLISASKSATVRLARHTHRGLARLGTAAVSGAAMIRRKRRQFTHRLEG